MNDEMKQVLDLFQKKRVSTKKIDSLTKEKKEQ